MAIGPGAVRVILAFAVLVSHVSRLDIGVPAVLCFFVLSGYWVTRLYDTHYRDLGVGVFYVSRVLRIWLPFLAAAILALGASAAGGDRVGLRELASLGILGIGTHHVDVTGVAWSLDVEIQFYLLVPLLWLVLRTRSRAAVSALWAAVALACVGGWALRLGTGAQTLPLYAPCFLAGACLHAFDLRPSARAAALSVVAFLGLGIAVALSAETRGLLLKGDPGLAILDVPFWLVWSLTLVPFLGWNVGQRSTPFDRHLGNYSYSLYLVHLPVIWVLAGTDGDSDPSDAAKLLAMGVAVAVSVAFYLAVDRPAERLRRLVVDRLVRARGQRRALS